MHPRQCRYITCTVGIKMQVKNDHFLSIDHASKTVTMQVVINTIFASDRKPWDV